MGLVRRHLGVGRFGRIASLALSAARVLPVAQLGFLLRGLRAIPFGPLLAWKRGDLLAAAERLWFGVLVAVVAMVAVWWPASGAILPALGVGLAVWVMAGAVIELAQRVKLFAEPLPVVGARMRGLPGSSWGMALAHFGIGMTVLGVVAESSWNIEKILVMKPGDTVELARLELSGYPRGPFAYLTSRRAGRERPSR